MEAFNISGQLIDLFKREIYPAEVRVENGKIIAINKLESAPEQYILPGFVDAHIHIESSMLIPTSFAQAAVVHGTVATISDPHEIANVCGMEGVRYMIENSKLSPFKFCFGAPSCVPATNFETAGATLDANDVATLLADKDIWYLSEMMNYPGVLNKDPEVMAKIAAAQKVGKPVDGHAPGLRGTTAAQYAAAGITTDHECFTLEEALDKVAVKMHILIREGSAAKNYEALAPLIQSHPQHVMFCSDDKHPDELVINHINAVVKRSLAYGYDLFNVLCAACLYPVMHYRIPVGLLRVGDPADFIVIDSIANFNILSTFIDGQKVAENGKSLLPFIKATAINNFKALTKQASELKLKAEKNTGFIRVIEAIEGQLVTNEIIAEAKIENGLIVSDVENDHLKLAVVNRYEAQAPISLAFIKNFNLKRGAIASTVGHDCHNIIAVGVDDESMLNAINALIDCKGGIAVADGKIVSILPLPVAGLMSLDDAQTVADAYTTIDKKAKELGTTLHAPFMTLSFMALLVIPALKLSDKGLFNGSSFTFTDVEV